MKKITLSALALALLSSGALMAQSTSGNEFIQERTVIDNEDIKLAKNKVVRNNPETPIWSEDFGSGIPSTWTNAGFNEFGQPLANAVWEYRGTATTPSNASGSRGAYSGVNSTPPTNLPVLSPTAGNGFVIFDSDWRDNNGVAGAFGTGSAPAPHLSALTSPTINLQNEDYVELSFYSYHRYFEGRALVVFSSDGGLTWPDTVAAHPGIAVNAASNRDAFVTINASNFIGGAQNARVRFLFDGTYDDPGAQGAGQGYYFWMIDDIEINPLPKFEVRFTPWGGAPSKDVLMEPVRGGSVKMGRLVKNNDTPWDGPTDQTRNIDWDCNAFNYGWGTLNNVGLTMQILDGNNTLLTSFTSATQVNNVASGDTVTYNDLNTSGTPWNPNARGTYKWVYTVTSDSAAVVTDTVVFYVTDSLMTQDFNRYDNRMGTPNIGNDGSALASRIDFNTSGALIKSVWIALAPGTTAGGTIAIDIFDSTGFVFASQQGYATAGLRGTQVDPLGYVITADDVAAGFIQIPVTDGTNPYVIAPANSAYFVSAVLFSNAGSNPIYLRNCQTFPQVTLGKVFKRTSDPANVRWFTGFLNSNTVNAFWIRPIISVSGIGVEENQLAQSIKIAPNPATSFVNVTFEEVSGKFTLTMTDITGRVVSKENVNVLGGLQHSIDVSGFAKGVYMLNINNGKASYTQKVIVQ